MSESDKTGMNVDSMVLGGPVALLFLMITIGLFQLRNTITFFTILLWIGLPVLSFIIVFIVNIISQKISCNTIQAGKALLGGIPVLISTVIGLAISSISYCRIPIASVFTPLFIGNTVDIVKNGGNSSVNNIKNSSKKCCTPSITLEQVEMRYPVIAGLDYGFYVMFSILFGFVFGNSIATIC